MSAFSGTQFKGAMKSHRADLKREAEERQRAYEALTLSGRVRIMQRRGGFPVREITRLILSVPGMTEHVNGLLTGWADPPLAAPTTDEQRGKK